jgi:hypothetical protein
MYQYEPVKTRELTKANQKTIEMMIKKLQEDPDKFERMFAAQYLVKYNLSTCKKHLEKAALDESDPEVVCCIHPASEKRSI